MKPAPDRNAEPDAADLAEMTALGQRLRAELDGAAEQPAYFWMRQQARIRERLAIPRAPLQWPIAAIVGLAVLGLVMVGIRPSAPPAARPVQSADADDRLLQDIQHSLAQRAPEPLLPANILVEEMTTGSNPARRED